MTDPAPSTRSFHEASYDWLLAHGTVRTVYGTVDYDSLIHMAACGVDLDRSEPIAAGRIPTFSDTFSEPDERDALVGAATCRCGRPVTLEHPPLFLGELIAAVATHEVTRTQHQPVPDQPAVGARLVFRVDAGGMLLAEVVAGPGGVEVAWRGRDGDRLSWAAAVGLLGVPDVH